MPATTIKLEGELLKDIERVKPPGVSVTEYVRETLRQRLDALKLREAAEAYKRWVAQVPEERAWLDEWDMSDLASAPRATRRARGSRP